MKKAAFLILVLSLIFCLAACSKEKTPEITSLTDVTLFTEAYTETTATTVIPELTTGAPVSDPTVSVPVTEVTTAAPVTEAATAAPVTEATTAAPVTEATTAAPVTQAPAAATEADILKMLSDAVNKTKAYTSPITVAHEEAFNIVEPAVTLDNAEGLSSLATRAVNFVKDLVLKPSSETYSFSNGTAKTSEGETTQLLLPKDKAFALTPDAIASAVITDENGMKHIKLVLKPEETHSLAEVPKNHANSIGYLDLDGSFKIIQIDELNIRYPGSVIDAFIRPDGYVQSVVYTINLEAFSKAHGMGISGSATFSGSQTEKWNINWQ